MRQKLKKMGRMRAVQRRAVGQGDLGVAVVAGEQV